MMDKIVEIANFSQAEEADLLVSLLRSEGIACYVRNGVSNRMFRGGVDIGARVELLESDVPHALEIIRDCGFTLPGEEEETSAEVTNEPVGLARHIPILRDFSLEKQIIGLIILIGGLLALIVYLNSYFNNHALT